MRHLDLFSGLGGFSYAAHKLGWRTVAFCERDQFCQQVLAKNFPGIPIYDDVYIFPSEPFRGRIDVLTGGFPCQPFSQAGKRLGVHDERHLFPEMLRIIREVQPAWFVLENVNGLTTMALETRDIKVGRTKYSRDETLDDYEAIYTREEVMLLNRICEDLEGEGYAVQPVIIPAVALEADHERKRIWFVGRQRGYDAPNAGREYGSRKPKLSEYEGEIGTRNAAKSQRSVKCDTERIVSNTVRVRPQRFGDEYDRQESSRLRHRKNTGRPTNWPEAAARFCRMDDGTSDELDFAGARDNRAERLKALGNAIYWPCAYEIFAAIEKVEQEEKEGR